MLCVSVKGSEVKEYDLNTFCEQDKLHYESYFYIVAMPTNTEVGTPKGEEFVLDVPQGRAVILTRKVRYGGSSVC